LIAKDSSLVTIGGRAFEKCISTASSDTSLRSFYIPRHVSEIGTNCFNKCHYLYLLEFGSSESLKRNVGDMPLDGALNKVVVSEKTGMLRIED
jgi:hypothetical protein